MRRIKAQRFQDGTALNHDLLGPTNNREHAVSCAASPKISRVRSIAERAHKSPRWKRTPIQVNPNQTNNPHRAQLCRRLTKNTRDPRIEVYKTNTAMDAQRNGSSAAETGSRIANAADVAATRIAAHRKTQATVTERGRGGAVGRGGSSTRTVGGLYGCGFTGSRLCFNVSTSAASHEGQLVRRPRETP
jgi:hypothetical protein